MDLAAMKQRYQDMLQAALAPFLAAQQTQTAPVQAQTVTPPAHCPDDQKVQCVVFFLEDRGTAWWETAERMLMGDVSKITWEKFKENFYAKFFSTNVKDAKQQVFLNLEQGNMTVEQYDVEFDMLSPFAPDVRHQGELAAAERTVRELPVCPTCERVHGDRCLAGSGVCFRCKQPGHTADACPRKPMETTPHQPPTFQQGRVFATTRQEVERAGTVVTGMLPILGHYAFVLFDSGSSHSFISSMFVQHVGLEVEPLGSVLSDFTPSGEVLLFKEKIKACQVEIANHVLDVTLLVLDIVILM
ncbi:ty3-gypsy retrotransposon protein [Cucumis melo var. makuwa]|uniref:Ty3-gypsy retrotransposon protein n=1 Tax=Cucumis melo var. makuwa TaxID=1194695 RepID=A0A5D3C4K7_CUCMM|nr:ty3-gypsy retrotransposon protein [Cucumis melo var. makuwa]TYK06244.1 ty3-gypsy retrotransposon protein [Cucumis melo var. makuwa]